MILTLLSLFPPVAAGLAVVGFRPCRHALFHVSLGAGIGIGLASLSFFLSLVAGVPLLSFELMLAAGAVAWWVVRRHRTCRFCQMTSPDPPTAFERLLLAGFAITLLCVAGAFLAESARASHGKWDAWAIYNLRARFLARGGAAWRDAFSPLLNWSHPDYPLLVPGFVARCWKLIGEESTWAPALTAFIYTLGTIGVLASGIAVLRRREEGWVAGLFLIGTPFFALHGAAQYADVPVAFFAVSAVLLLALRQNTLAALCAGLAAWSKNEGLLLVAVLSVAFCFLLARERATDRNRELIRFAAGLAPVLAVILCFRSTLATPNSFFSNPSGAAGHPHILEPERYLLVIRGFVQHVWSFGDLIVTPFLFLALYLWLVKPDRKAGSRALCATGIVAAMTAGYAMVYVISPGEDLNWLIETSLDRLLLQVWPICIAAAILWGRDNRAPAH